jgi:hypothetical protein
MEKINSSNRYFYNFYKDKSKGELNSLVKIFNSNIIILYSAFFTLLPIFLFSLLYYKDIFYSQNNSDFSIRFVTPLLFVMLILICVGTTYYGVLTCINSKRNNYYILDDRKQVQQELYKLESLLIAYKEEEIRKQLTSLNNNEAVNELHTNAHKYWNDYNEILDKYEQFFKK